MKSSLMRVGVVCLAMFLLLGVAVRAQLSARLNGTEVDLRVGVLDPIDPFRGAYVALAYPDLPGLAAASPAATDSFGSGVVFVPLERKGQVWVGRPPVREEPGGRFLRCAARGERVDCGIDSLFLPQREAAAVSTRLRETTAVATVKVDDSGNAALLGVR